MQQNYQHNTPPQPVAPAAMGYAQMPIHEVVSLTVMKERYAEMVEQKARTEKQRDEAESNLRIAKEKEAALQIRLDSIEDRHSFAMERAEASQKKWLDKLEPNQVLEALPALSGLITAMKGNGAAPQVGMGNPMPQLSEDKTNFLQTLKQVPDDLIPLLESFVYHIMTNENYRNEVTMYLNSMDQQIPQG